MTTRQRSSPSLRRKFLRGSLLILSLSLLLILFFLFPGWLAEWRDRSVFLNYDEPSFGKEGVISYPQMSGIAALGFQSDRKIILGGTDFTLMRILSDGAKDMAFGKDGLLKVDLERNGQLNALSVKGEDILAAGNCEKEGGGAFPCGVRVQAGQWERFSLPESEEGCIRAIGEDHRGVLWLAGTLTKNRKRSFAVWRNLIPIVVDFEKGASEATSLVIQPDGKIVVGGFSQQGAISSIALARFQTSGELDLSFGNQGKVITAFRSSSNFVYSLALQKDGKILAGGSSGGTANYDFAIARFLSSGEPDATFGFGGLMTLPVGDGDDIIHGLHLYPNEKILAMGAADLGSLQHGIALGRFQSEGKLDSRFGEEGVAIFSSGGFTPYASALQANGKLLVAGQRVDEKSGQFRGFVARFQRNGNLDRP